MRPSSIRFPSKVNVSVGMVLILSFVGLLIGLNHRLVKQVKKSQSGIFPLTRIGDIPAVARLSNVAPSATHVNLALSTFPRSYLSKIRAYDRTIALTKG